MYKSNSNFFFRHKTFWLFVLVSIGIKIFSSWHSGVEHYYTYGLYPFLAGILRIVFGWIPFSMGDILYAAVAVYLIYAVVKIIRRFKKTGFKKPTLYWLVYKVLRIALIIYIVFNVLWGINYNRLGIASQLKLEVAPYSMGQLDTLATVLQERLNLYAQQEDTLKRLRLNQHPALLAEAIRCYRNVAEPYPFLTYRASSVKPSLYSNVGHLFGFTGYYNPFSGEAQLKTSVPVFIKPFVVVHEMAHQLGYAKENEANFVAYLASRTSSDNSFRYSVYFELYWYAMGELYYKSSKADILSKVALRPQVFKDYQELRRYLLSTQNVIEPYVSKFYDRYLKFNDQPEGIRTYNEVIAWLIAYQKKFGIESI